MTISKKTKKVFCGNIGIGGGEPISIQSMTNINPLDKKGLINQIISLKKEGCDIVRLAVPNKEAVKVFQEVKEELKFREEKIPLVADIHFDYRLALAAIEAGADKIRINPGNIGSESKIREVVKAAAERNIPIRVGVNSGSLEKDIVETFGGVTPEGLAESALRNLAIIENMGYDNLVVSLKSSSVKMNYDAHRIVASKTDHPIHIGITEAGTLKRGKLKSAMGLGALLVNSIGDTMRISLTADPLEEIKLAKEILSILGLRSTGVNLISCPTCGRTRIDLQGLAERVEEALEAEDLDKPITVAVMGCAVNGPGEAREADFGVAGGDGKGLLFAKGEIVKTVEEENITEELIKLIKEELK